MTRKCQLPFTGDRLTPVEEYVQHEQERRNCITCDLLQRHNRSGARVCDKQADHDYNPCDVICGRVKCEDYDPI